jgi:hypothetical protein
LEELIIEPSALGLTKLIEEEGFMSGEDRSQTTKLQQSKQSSDFSTQVFVFFFFSITKHLGSFVALVAAH